MKRTWVNLAVALLAGLVMSGCTKEAQEKYGEAGDKAAEAAGKTGEAIAKDAKVAGEVAGQAADDAGKVVSAVTMATRVKAEIVDAKDIDSKDVDVDGVDKTITLKGSVDTAAQKTKAEAIAKEVTKGSDFTVMNELKVKDN